MDFKNAKELLELSQNEKLTISEVMRQRELSETENSPEINGVISFIIRASASVKERASTR